MFEGRDREVLFAFVVSVSCAIFFVRFDFQALVVVLLFGVCALPFVISIRRGPIDVFEPILFYSIFMLMTVIAIFDRLYIKDPYLLHPEWVSRDFSTAFLLLSSLYLLFFMIILIGYYFAIERWIEVPTFISDQEWHNATVYRRLGIIYMFVGFLFYTLLVGTALDWELLRIYRTTEPRSEIFAGAHHLVLGSRMLYIGYLAWLTGIIIESRRPGILHLTPAVVLTGLFLLLGGRQRAITIVLITVILVYYTSVYPIVQTTPRWIRFAADEVHRKAKLLTLPVSGVLVGISFVVLRAARSGREIGETFSYDTIIRVLTAGIHNYHLDYFIVTLEIVPERFGYYWGTLFLRVPLNYVPRAAWTDKPPLTVGAELRRVILPDATGGRPPGMIGHFYVDGGFIGILVGAFLFGVLLRLLYVLLQRNQQSPVFILLYAIFVASSVPMGISNNSLWVVSNHLLLLAPILTADWASRRDGSVVSEDDSTVRD